jgi:hypothetical protein
MGRAFEMSKRKLSDAQIVVASLENLVGKGAPPAELKRRQ